MVEFDLGNFPAFVARLKEAGRGDFKKDLTLFLHGLGADFLQIVQDEIIRRKVMDSRLLLASFSQGDEGNVWEIGMDGLTLQVGTNVKYAQYVNDGHWANPKGVERRFVPGRWEGNRFIYDPNSDTGMVLKQQWIEGAHYWESAIKIFEKVFPKLLEKKLQEWLNSYFSDFV
jgi:hypothetical protein